MPSPSCRDVAIKDVGSVSIISSISDQLCDLGQVNVHFHMGTMEESQHSSHVEVWFGVTLVKHSTKLGTVPCLTKDSFNLGALVA